MGNFFWSAGHIKFFWLALQATLGHTLVQLNKKVTFLHKALVNCFEKSVPRAGQKNSAGRTLPTPGIEGIIFRVGKVMLGKILPNKPYQ